MDSNAGGKRKNKGQGGKKKNKQLIAHEENPQNLHTFTEYGGLDYMLTEGWLGIRHSCGTRCTCRQLTQVKTIRQGGSKTQSSKQEETYQSKAENEQSPYWNKEPLKNQRLIIIRNEFIHGGTQRKWLKGYQHRHKNEHLKNTGGTKALLQRWDKRRNKQGKAEGTKNTRDKLRKGTEAK